jgi:hypothetical protein
MLILHSSFLISIAILDIIHCPVFYLNHNVLETACCLRFHVLPTQLGPIDRASFCLSAPTEEAQPEDGDRIQSPKSCVLNKKQNDG